MSSGLEVNQTYEEVSRRYTAHSKSIGGGTERLMSKILPVRDYNNWVKTALIQTAKALIRSRRNTAILDLCCGKGGDLKKYAKLGCVGYYAGLDITTRSLAEATQRYNELWIESERRSGARGWRDDGRLFEADFVLVDVMSVELWRHFGPERFDIVSCQFALHYAFETAATADCFFSNVKALLARNGCFIAVFPCKDTILKRLRARDWVSGPPPTLENNIYRLQLAPSDDLDGNHFGQAYEFTLVEALEETTEYLIDMRAFKELCHKHHLAIRHEVPNIELLLSNDLIPAEARSIFPRMMRRTARFNALLERRLRERNLAVGDTWAVDNQDEFWNGIVNADTDQRPGALQDEHTRQQDITSLDQINEEYLEVIRLYQAVIVQHADNDAVPLAPPFRNCHPQPKTVYDICNLTGQDIDYGELRRQLGAGEDGDIVVDLEE